MDYVCTQILRRKKSDDFIDYLRTLFPPQVSIQFINHCYTYSDCINLGLSWQKYQVIQYKPQYSAHNAGHIIHFIIPIRFFYHNIQQYIIQGTYVDKHVFIMLFSYFFMNLICIKTQYTLYSAYNINTSKIVQTFNRFFSFFISPT